VNRLVCEDCGTVYYSAAAKTLAEQGATCAKCGGRLVYEDGTRKVPASGPRPVAENGD
jgi:transcription initiation factor IIE alpha subunit